jgi:NAD(P)-dependent dehydrogenase (short-subunit alcohol dehydrogenase family)
MGEKLRFDGRVAIVTGAGRGMGEAHALLLAERGARVVVNDLGGASDGGGGSEKPAELVASKIAAGGGIAVASVTDVATESGAERLIATALDAFGRVDIVVNNAGIMNLAPIADLTADRFDQTMRVNAYGPFYVTRAAWPHLAASGAGRVVMVSSGAGIYGMADRTHYAASKAALIGMTRVLSLEGHQAGIKVNALIPSALTRMTTAATRARLERELASLGGAGAAHSPGKVSPVVGWLAHEKCDITGEIIEAADGYVSRVFIGATPGYHADDLTIETIAAGAQAMMDTKGFVIPADVQDRGRLRNAAQGEN